MIKITNILKRNMFKYKESSLLLKTIYITLGSIVFPTILTSFLFILRLSVTPYHYIVSIILLLVSYFYMFYNSDKKICSIIPILIGLIVNITSMYISCKMMEITWDGWEYHTPAIIDLKNGWNPLYTHDDTLNTWVLHYPKFIWIYGACLYSTFGNMFMGTSFNLTIAITLFMLVIDFLMKYKINKTISIIIALSIAFNPVSVGQFFSYYNDGVLGICVIALIIIMSMILDKKYDLKSSMIWYLVIFYTSILVNIKFTGALFAVIILMIYFLVFFIKKIIKFDRNLLFYIISLGFGVLVVAINTYLPNFIYHNNIGYPIVGKDKIDIIKPQTPIMFDDDSKIKSFIKSNTTYKSNENGRYNDYIFSYRPMYIITKEDIKCTIKSDCRIGGFGPQYQSILIISFIILAIVISKEILCVKKNTSTIIEFIKMLIKRNIVELLIIANVLIMFFITPAVWWSRYIPYFYSVPLIILFHSFEMKKRMLEHILMYILIFIYSSFAIILMFNKYVDQKNLSNELKTEITNIEKDIKDGYSVIEREHSKYYYKVKVRKTLLNDMKIYYKEVNDSSCKIVHSYGRLGVNTVNCNS